MFSVLAANSFASLGCLANRNRCCALLVNGITVPKGEESDECHSQDTQDHDFLGALMIVHGLTGLAAFADSRGWPDIREVVWNVREELAIVRRIFPDEVGLVGEVESFIAEPAWIVLNVRGTAREPRKKSVFESTVPPLLAADIPVLS